MHYGKNMKNEKLSAAIGDFAISLTMLTCTLAVQAIVFGLLWGWYIVPLGLPPITWVHGFMLLILFRTAIYRSGDETTPSLTKSMTAWIIAGIAGYLCSGFVA